MTIATIASETTEASATGPLASVALDHDAWAAEARTALETLLQASALAPTLRCYVDAGLRAARAAIARAAS